MVEGSVVGIVATLAGNTVIITNAPCRGVSAVNTSCLSRVDFEDWHAQTSLDRRSVRLVLPGWSPVYALVGGLGVGPLLFSERREETVGGRCCQLVSGSEMFVRPLCEVVGMALASNDGVVCLPSRQGWG